MALPRNDADKAWQGMELIARGANRICVRDPDEPKICLKFERPLAERTQVGWRQTLRRWLGVRFPQLGENRTELRAYRKLRARLGSRTDGPMAACHGLVITANGDALRCDCALLEDGTPARSLHYHLFVDRAYPAASLCAAVDRFEQWLLHYEVPLFDLNAGNFVVLPRIDGLHLVCVDAKSVVSGKEIVPISRWVRPLMRRKIQRRAQRLRQRINTVLAGGSELAGRGGPD